MKTIEQVIAQINLVKTSSKLFPFPGQKMVLETLDSLLEFITEEDDS